MFGLLKNKKVLVIGGAGFVGSNLIKRLLSLGEVDIRATIHIKDPQINDQSIEYVKLKINKNTSLRELIKHDIENDFMNDEASISKNLS